MSEILEQLKQLTEKSKLQRLANPPKSYATYESVDAVVAYIAPELKISREQLAYVVSAAVHLSSSINRLGTPGELWKAFHKELESVNLSLEQITRLFNDDQFMRAIYLRGIRSESNGLDGRMLLALQVLTDFSSRKSPTAKLRLIGVKPYEYQAWLNYGPFLSELKRLSTKALGDSVNGAKVTLANRAIDGDLNAIKFLFEVTGEFNPENRARFDGERLVRGMAEIIMEYVKEPDVLREIAGKISVLLAANGVEQ